MNFLSNNIYIELINNINEAVILHDKYGNILDANKYACDNLDYKKEELLKLKIFDIEKAYSKSYLLKLWNNFDDNFKVVKGIHQDKNKNSHQVSVKVGLIDKDKKIFFVITKYKEHKLAKDAYQNYDVILTILQEVFIKQKKIKLENLGDFILEKIKSFIQFDYGCILIFDKSKKLTHESIYINNKQESKSYLLSKKIHSFKCIFNIIKESNIILSKSLDSYFTTTSIEYDYFNSMKIERLSFATVECYNFEIISIFGYKQKKFISYNFEFFILKILKDLLDMYLFRKHIYNKNILSNKKLKNALMHSIESIFLSLEHRDSYTAYHQIKVAMLSLAIYDHRKLNKKYRLDTLFGGLIHDIGKLYIPLDLLMAPRRLVKEEYDLIKLHSQKGYDIVENLPISDYTKEIILQHHERLDGSGYPNGLENEKISNGAKIIAVADVFDAMYSNRPYREKLPLSIVKEELISNRDILYCSESINSCIQLIENDFKFPNIDFNIKKFFKEIDNI